LNPFSNQPTTNTKLHNFPNPPHKFTVRTPLKKTQKLFSCLVFNSSVRSLIGLPANQIQDEKRESQPEFRILPPMLLQLLKRKTIINATVVAIQIKTQPGVVLLEKLVTIGEVVQIREQEE